jgi:hypothetical protein
MKSESPNKYDATPLPQRGVMSSLAVAVPAGSWNRQEQSSPLEHKRRRLTTGLETFCLEQGTLRFWEGQ